VRKKKDDIRLNPEERKKKAILEFNSEQGFIIIRTLQTLYIISDKDSEGL